jgi:hypothetical protein
MKVALRQYRNEWIAHLELPIASQNHMLEEAGHTGRIRRKRHQKGDVNVAIPVPKCGMEVRAVQLWQSCRAQDGVATDGCADGKCCCV